MFVRGFGKGSSPWQKQGTEGPDGAGDGQHPGPWQGDLLGSHSSLQIRRGGVCLGASVYSFVKTKRQDQARPPCRLFPVFQMEMVNGFRIFIHVSVYSCLDYKSDGGAGGAVQGSREWARGRHHICLPASRSHSPSRLCLSRGWGEPSRLPPAPASWSPTPAPAGWPGSWPGRQNQNGLLWPDDTPEPASCSVTGARLPSPKASSPSSSSVRWRWEPLASPSLPPPPPGPAQPPAPGGTLALPLNGHVTSQGPSHR